MSEREEPRRSFWDRCAGKTPRDRRNLSRMVRTYAAWTLAFIGGSQLIKRGIVTTGPIPWLIAALVVGLGVLVVVTYARFLREADELQRMIHLEALALGFGGGWIAVSCYRLFERLGAPSADIADATIALALFYAIGMFRGTWRFR